MNISRVSEVVSRLGGVLTGAADVSPFSPEHPIAVVAAVPIDRFIIAGIRRGPTKEYVAAYFDANEKLKAISAGIKALIRASGFSAERIPVTVTESELEEDGCGPDTLALTHKVAAYLAGLGDFGRNGLLLTPE